MRRRDRARPRDEHEEIGARFEDVRSPGPYPKKWPLLRRKKRQRRSNYPARRVVLAVLLLLVVLYGIYLLAGAVFGGGEEPVTVVVEKGDTLSIVADKLKEAGVIRSSTLFKIETRLEGEDTEIKAGEYRFVPGEGRDEILKTLSSGDSVSTFTITIPEGLTLEQTASTVEEQSGIPAEEFEAAAEKTDYGFPFLSDPAVKNTEGFLFPKQYEFEKDADAEQIVKRLLEQYVLETKDLDFATAENRLNLTEYELITTASLIEKESANPEERPIIASVIYNRIHRGMPLQVDATIQYVLGKPKEDLDLADLEVDSPYNTYENRGLPPGPIASPSRESIQAALQPAETDYLYYVLEADGKKHFFTDDYDEFLEAKDER